MMKGNLRILYLARLPPSEYTLTKLIKSIVRRYRFDLLIIGGDCRLDPHTLLNIVSNKEVIWVPGDEDDIMITKVCRSLGILCSGSLYHLNDYAIACIGGIDAIQDIKKVMNILDTDNQAKESIIISHYPLLNELHLTVNGRTVFLNLGVNELLSLINRSKVMLSTHVRHNYVNTIGASLILGLKSSYNGHSLIIDIKKPHALSAYFLKITP